MMATADSARLLSKNELAKLLGMSARTVDRLRDARKLPAPVVLSARLLRWDRAAVERWISDGAPVVLETN